jgi:hypothetical protein
MRNEMSSLIAAAAFAITGVAAAQAPARPSAAVSVPRVAGRGVGAIDWPEILPRAEEAWAENGSDEAAQVQVGNLFVPHCES